MSDLVIDQGQRCAYLKGQMLALSPQEYRLLNRLAESGGEVVSKRDLLAAMWSTSTHSPSDAADFDPISVDLVVFRLRKKLGDDAQHPTYLETRRGFGYLLHHATLMRMRLPDPTAHPQSLSLQASIIPSEQPTDPTHPFATLTRREWEIFLRLADEQTIRLTDKALAQQLRLAEGTLKKHLQHIYRKLGVENRSGATLMAMRFKAS